MRRDEDGFCLTCLDDFRYDDIGGYNPPCSCGLHCRSCHELADERYDEMREREEDVGEISSGESRNG